MTWEWAGHAGGVELQITMCCPVSHGVSVGGGGLGNYVNRIWQTSKSLMACTPLVVAIKASHGTPLWSGVNRLNSREEDDLWNEFLVNSLLTFN